ncbi:DNA-3-methyladenine glycosylase I [Aidingimonas lacisalsi]|uniref:DNA-3-methyladenine glycosylase I n=1 Tax=Aidingimonas lacisalsi TaxID=2604086 RepID=UPI0011D24E28|nr:DNA-3-methyladenine glycosylase I [Aidingimonas lacisalsi]
MADYCDLAPGHPYHGPYHDDEYGFPVNDDDTLFERLILEINQAGLSWLTVLKKRDAFHDAFEGFQVAQVARYGDEARQRLLNDARIIRNRRKVDAAIHNANVVKTLQSDYGSFQHWLDQQHPLPLADWVKVFKSTFRFTGPEIVNEFLMSTGYLPGAHRDDCPVQAQVLACHPPWARP